MISRSKNAPRTNNNREDKPQYRKECLFCKEETTPDFKDFMKLKRYITERGKIQPRSRSGVCAKHQRLLATAIKQARQLALIPDTASM